MCVEGMDGTANGERMMCARPNSHRTGAVLKRGATTAAAAAAPMSVGKQAMAWQGKARHVLTEVRAPSGCGYAVGWLGSGTLTCGTVHAMHLCFCD
jgi:hypothetical protein